MKNLIFDLSGKSLFFQLFFLAILILLGLLLAISFSAVTGMLIAGMDGLSKVNEGDLSDPVVLHLAKTVQIFTQIGLFLFPSFLFAYFYEEKNGDFLRIRSFPHWKLLLVSVLAIVLMIPFIGLLVKWNEQMHLPSFLAGIEYWMRIKEDEAKRLTDAFLKVNTVKGLIINLFMIGFLAGFGEELLFRGVLQRIVYNKTRRLHFSVWITAFVFSAIHLQFYGFLPRMVLGALFGYVYFWTEQLWVPVIMHAVFNSVTVVAAYLSETGAIDTSYEDFGYTDNYFVVAISFVLATACLYWIYSRGKHYSFR